MCVCVRERERERGGGETGLALNELIVLKAEHDDTPS